MIGCGILPQPILILLFSYFININIFLIFPEKLRSNIAHFFEQSFHFLRHFV